MPVTRLNMSPGGYRSFIGFSSGSIGIGCFYVHTDAKIGLISPCGYVRACDILLPLLRGLQIGYFSLEDLEPLGFCFG